MEIKLNDYDEPEHFRALCEDNFNVSRTCEYEKNEMHHIHNSCEILLVETGSADYFIFGKKYHIEAGDVLVIGSREHHMRHIDELPYQRYGLTLMPRYYKSCISDLNLLRVFETYCQKIEKESFDELVALFQELLAEEQTGKPFQSLAQRLIISKVAIVLFRAFGYQIKKERAVSAAYERMQEIKSYIDEHFSEELDLKRLSEKFYLHPATISKEFPKSCGQTLTQYINTVRTCEAAKLLENTDDSVEEISLKVGYGSVNTLIRQFKATVEISPLQYRKSFRKFVENRRKHQNNHKTG